MERYINESFYHDEMSLSAWESLLAGGWDRVGTHFYRRQYDVYKMSFMGEEMMMRMELMPLRYRLSDFFFTKSQRKIYRKNDDLRCVVQPVRLTDEKCDLFERWYVYRFGKVATIHSWVINEFQPFPTQEVMLYDKDRLIACSFFDKTRWFQYSTTAMYEPNEAHRSLGTYTLMCEIINGIGTGKRYHYPGHAYVSSSIYDYKKKFANKEFFNWNLQAWTTMP